MEILNAAAKIITQAGLATPGEDMFVETMPEDVSAGIMLQLPPGGEAIDRGQEGFYHSWFGLVVRDPDGETAYARCRAVAKALIADNLHVDDIFILTMHPRSKPSVFPRGPSDLIESACEIHVAYVEASA